MDGGGGLVGSVASSVSSAHLLSLVPYGESGTVNGIRFFCFVFCLTADLQATVYKRYSRLCGICTHNIEVIPGVGWGLMERELLHQDSETIVGTSVSLLGLYNCTSIDTLRPK